MSAEKSLRSSLIPAPCRTCGCTFPETNHQAVQDNLATIVAERDRLQERGNALADAVAVLFEEDWIHEDDGIPARNLLETLQAYQRARHGVSDVVLNGHSPAHAEEVGNDE